MKPQCRKQNCVVEAGGASHSPIHSAFLPGPSRRYFGTMEEPLGTVEQSLKTVGSHLKGPASLWFRGRTYAHSGKIPGGTFGCLA